jgi:hypothetical protein
MSEQKRQPWDAIPQVAGATNCFHDSFLVRPDDFRLGDHRGIGFQPVKIPRAHPIHIPRLFDRVQP